MAVKVVYRNIFESGTVAVTSEDASFPKTRLYDRDIGKLFKGNSTPANFGISVEQGTELVTNGDMELDANWTSKGTPETNERSATEKHGDTYSRHVIDSTPSLGGIYQKLAMTAGLKYNLDFWYYLVSGESLIARITEGDGSETSLGGIECSATGAWTHANVTVAQTVSGVDGEVHFLNSSSESAAEFYIDDVSIKVVYEVDRLIIPSGHNLNGLVLSLYYSDDDINWTPAVSWTQPDTAIINKSLTPSTHRWWDLNIAAPSAAPELPELFLGKDYAFTRDPTWGSKVGKKKNVLRDETQSGKARRVKLGEAKRTASYDLLIFTAQKTAFEAWETANDGIIPFWLIDENATLMYMESMNDLEFTYKAFGIWTCQLELLEVLP